MTLRPFLAAVLLVPLPLAGQGTNHALLFDGVDDFVTAGVAPELGVGGPPTRGMTIECWFRQDGAGSTASSGLGGVTCVPLFGKGRGEMDGSHVDCNFILGIDAAGRLVADFETMLDGRNQPLTGSHPPIAPGVWHHAAATYDGIAGRWTLYLDGLPVAAADLPPGTSPRHDSIQHFGIGTAIDSTGETEGAFAGAIDEVRIWDFARTANEVGEGMELEIAAAPGLVGRFGLNEGTGTTAASSAGGSTGTLVNGPAWTAGAPFPALPNRRPEVVISQAAPDAEAFLGHLFPIAVEATDPDGSVVNVAWWVDGVAIGEDPEPPFQLDWLPQEPGPRVLRAVATDDRGGLGFSAEWRVRVGYHPEEIPANTALAFDGRGNLVTMGPAPELNLGSPPGGAFTLECWFRRSGPGEPAYSGDGGVWAVPLFGKGRGEEDGSELDCNVFFGIDENGHLTADFEDMVDGSNHPVTAAHDPLLDTDWHHAAATFEGDGGVWTLYLDGVQVGTATVPAGLLPHSGSIQHFAIGSSLNSAGVREGGFAGVIDEVRLWDHARSAQEIAAARHGEIASAPGLVERFGLNEGRGAETAGSVGGSVGTLVRGPVWVPGFPAPENPLPEVALTAPADGAVAEMPYPVDFTATASDADGISKVVFLVDGAHVGEATAAPFHLSWTPPAPGTYSVRALARDALGAGKLSPAVTLTLVANGNQPPAANLDVPAAGAVVPTASVTLGATLADPEGEAMTVTFYGRETAPAVPGPDFTVVAIPDTQYYSEGSPELAAEAGMTPEALVAIAPAQTRWIVEQREARNIVFATHMGDLVQNGGVELEWQRASAAMGLLEDPLTTLKNHGIPFGAAPGNHDYDPVDAFDTGSTALFNQYFGTARYAGRDYWGGHHGADNVNSYQLFSASGLDFVILHLAYDPTPAQAVLDWADAVLKAYPHRRAIVTSHHLIFAGNPADFSVQGAAIYQALKDNPNLFLMLCGHISSEGFRKDVHQGHTVYTVLSDYQELAAGGNGFLRTLAFSPAANRIRVESWSPTLGRAATPADGLPHFDGTYDLAYDMQSAVTGWIPLGTVQVPAGGTAATLDWSGLRDGANYEWYAAVTDGLNPLGTAPRRFRVNLLPEVSLTAPDPAGGEFGPDRTLVFRVERTGATDLPLEIPLEAGGSATAGEDYAGFSSPLVIGSGQAEAELELTVLADALAEGTETVILALGIGAGFTSGAAATATAEIADRPAQEFYFSNIPDAGHRHPTADPDGDDRANVVEYFMGTLPADANSRGVLEIPAAAGNAFRVRYPRALNRPDVSGQLRWSADLLHWHASGGGDGDRTVTFAESVISAPGSDPELVEAAATVTGSVPVAGLFVRLEVE